MHVGAYERTSSKGLVDAQTNLVFEWLTFCLSQPVSEPVHIREQAQFEGKSPRYKLLEFKSVWIRGTSCRDQIRSPHLDFLSKMVVYSFLYSGLEKEACIH